MFSEGVRRKELTLEGGRKLGSGRRIVVWRLVAGVEGD